MNTVRFGTWVGLALGAVWSIAGFGWALLTAFLAAVGAAAGFFLQRRGDDLGDVVRERFGPSDRAEYTRTERKEAS